MTNPNRKPPAMTEKTFSPTEAADHLGYAAGTIYRAIQNNELAHTRADNGYVTITQTDLDTWVNRPKERGDFDVPSPWIADKTGYHRTAIYKMRKRGNTSRTLDMERFERLQDVFGWSVDDQIAAARGGRWGDEFEKVVTAAYDKETGAGS